MTFSVTDDLHKICASEAKKNNKEAEAQTDNGNQVKNFLKKWGGACHATESGTVDFHGTRQGNILTGQ